MMKKRRFWLVIPLGLLVVCLGLIGFLYLSNLSLPTQSQVVDRLSEPEKARLLEATHLRESLGDQVWPGWQDQDIPIIVYNEGYAFLVGLNDPVDGWVKVPQEQPRGGPWELVPDESIGGQPYYRQQLADANRTPENFTVLVGDRWVATLQTNEFMFISFAQGFRSELPSFVGPIFPYRLAFQTLIRGSDGYITTLLHEAFHAFQGMQVADRLAAAERSMVSEGKYPWDQPASEESWKQELELLYRAATADTDASATELARQFLAQRDLRRATTDLSGDLVDFEREREWLEGLAKYAELDIGLVAAETPAYQPLEAIQENPDFKNYSGRVKFWSNQLSEVKRMTNNDSEARFYYTGFAQAVTLDRLMPDWKSEAFDEGVYLEDLLRQAVK